MGLLSEPGEVSPDTRKTIKVLHVKFEWIERFVPPAEYLEKDWPNHVDIPMDDPRDANGQVRAKVGKALTSFLHKER